MPPAALTADSEFRKRFSREADIAAELRHRHLVGIHDRREFEGQLWLSMDYAEGLTPPTVTRSFAFRVPRAMTNGTSGTHINAELIRQNQIAPAVAK